MESDQNTALPDSEEDSMLARPKLGKPELEEEATRKAGQTKPHDHRFVVRVDGQSKRSFEDKKSAAAYGAAIKKSFPIVVVTISDTREGASERVDG